MEKNTVLLSLKDYNEFRDFKRNSEDNYIPTFGMYGSYHYLTKDKVIKEIAEHNKGLQDEIYKLKDKIVKLKHPEMFKPTINNIKSMSIWQFIKWKRCDKGGFVLTNKG